jgi:hypothetical protein
MATTDYLPGFSHHLHGRPAGVRRQALGRQAAKLDGLAALVARFVPVGTFELPAGGRKRVFTPWVTFVAFLGQVLTRGSSCREAVRRVQTWFVAEKQTPPDQSTSAYCQARARLSVESLREAHQQVGQWMERHAQDGWRWCQRRVRVLDGCGVSMPDTAQNRAQWPYAGCQRPGCGFPTAQLVGLFCLGSGRLMRFAFESWKAHEIPLARQLLAWIEPHDVVVTDRGFSGWGLIALLQRHGADVVMRAHQARKLKGSLMQWAKPQRPQTCSQSEWSALPATLAIRIVRFKVAVPGFRTQEVVLTTTLLDEQAYPDEQIMALYRRRWAVELCFRDIKTTLGLDVLRCESPELVEKEVWLQVLAYNLVRALMVEAAWTHHIEVDRMSFKGTVDTLRQWTPLLAPRMFVYKHARAELLRVIAADALPSRPNRSEPRAKKRRPKNYQFLSQPRPKMIVSPSRSRK